MPFSRFKKVWNICIILMLVYLITVDIYVMAFVKSEAQTVFKVINYLIDFAFIVDIVINFMSAYTTEYGRLETQFKRIALNYITGFFFIDVVASIPFQDLLYLFKILNNVDVTSSVQF